jgi:hypothetical protein
MAKKFRVPHILCPPSLVLYSAGNQTGVCSIEHRLSVAQAIHSYAHDRPKRKDAARTKVFPVHRVVHAATLGAWVVVGLLKSN